MKLWNYMVIFTGLALIMEMAGITVAGFSDLFSLIGINFDTSNHVSSFVVDSTFWNALFNTSTGILTTLAVSSVIAIGLFATSRDKSFLILPFLTGTVYYWISIVVGIVNFATSSTGGVDVWIGAVLGLIMIPLTVGFIQSSVDYFMGLT